MPGRSTPPATPVSTPSPLPPGSSLPPLPTDLPQLSSHPDSTGLGRRLVTFGRTDPLHLTERYIALFGSDHATFAWPSTFKRDPPPDIHTLKTDLLRYYLPAFEEVWCGTGATMFEALLAGCKVFVISSPDLGFAQAFSTLTHYDHSLRPVWWRHPGTLIDLFEELRSRLK